MGAGTTTGLPYERLDLISCSISRDSVNNAKKNAAYMDIAGEPNAAG